MPISDASFGDQQTPVSKLQKLMRLLDKGSIEAHFTDKNGEPTVSREYVEMVFQDYAISQQNSQIMNKWISLDTKLDKSILEYLSDVKMLIASVTQTGMAQSSVESPVDMSLTSSPGEGISEAPEALKASARDRQLPVSREE